MKTLVIVDVQNDFMPAGALAVPDGDEIVPVINEIQHRFDLIVATQDWHPPGHASFASSHDASEPFEQIELNGKPQTLWPDHCVQGTRGAAFHPQLDLNRVAAIVRKGMDQQVDSYSGFFDNDHEHRTGLGGYLKEMDASELYICGLAAEICVAYTARDAAKLGFAVSLIEDATRPLEQQAFEVMKQELRSIGVQTISVSDIG